MSEKFTKGPWSRDKYGNLLDASGNGVAFRGMTILCSGGPERVAEAEANTSLAGASTEMYFALSNIMNDLPSNKDWLDPDLERFARAALAKAIGEEL